MFSYFLKRLLQWMDEMQKTSAHTLEYMIEQENKTLEYWENKAQNAEKIAATLFYDAVENREEAIYARNCVGIQNLKIQQLEKELNDRSPNNN